MSAPSELVVAWTLLGRAIPLVAILKENEQAIEWLADINKYLNEGRYIRSVEEH